MAVGHWKLRSSNNNRPQSVAIDVGLFRSPSICGGVASRLNGEHVAVTKARTGEAGRAPGDGADLPQPLTQGRGALRASSFPSPSPPPQPKRSSLLVHSPEVGEHPPLWGDVWVRGVKKHPSGALRRHRPWLDATRCAPRFLRGPSCAWIQKATCGRIERSRSLCRSTKLHLYWESKWRES